MSQFSNSSDDTFSSAAPGNDPTSLYAPTGWLFSLGAPLRVNAWGAPIFPQPSPSSPGSLPSFASSLAPPTPQSASSDSAWLPDWIANRSLLGAIPREFNKPAGSGGLLGLLAQPALSGGFFPSDEAGIRQLLANHSSDDWAIPSQPGWPYSGQAAAPTQSSAASVPSPPASPGTDSTTQPPAAASWYGYDAPGGANARGAPDFTQTPVSSPILPSNFAATGGMPAQPAQAAPVPSSPDATPAQMPNPLDALVQGIGSSARGVGQTLRFIPPTSVAPPSPAAALLSWSDLTSPWAQLAPKLAYRFGESSPTLAVGTAGAALGSFIGPEGTAAGAIIGGSLGAAAMSAVQTLGPAYAAELQRTPDDPEGAWQRAWRQAEISGAFSGAAWALFPARFFQGPVKQLLFQTFGVQPGLSVAEQATRNVAAGRPLQEGLGDAYGEGVLGTLNPALGYAGAKGVSTRLGAGARRTPTIHERLQMHVDNALTRLQSEQGLTNRQRDSVGPRPYLALTHAGERVDTFAKESIALDPNLRHLIVTPRGKFGPDFIDPINNTWYDITTSGSWRNHVRKYTPGFGQGFALFYRLEDRK